MLFRSFSLRPSLNTTGRIPKAAACASRRPFGGLASPYTAARRSARMAATAAAAKRVLVPVGNGSEEMEAVITIDVLRRAGAEVVVASVEGSLEVVCSRGVRLVADALIGAAVRSGPYDLVALPGGMPGAERLRDSGPLRELVRQLYGEAKAAEVAAPMVMLPE